MDRTAVDEGGTPLQAGDPRRLGRYELIGRLGQGGQGAVFLGRSPEGTRVAVKLLHPDLAHDAAARARFVREVGAAKRVARFCTAQVLDTDVDGDRPYIVGEYVSGPSLHRLVGDRGPLAGAALERLAIGTATALVAIHQAGVVHRDFKPHNVLIGSDGPRVIDFGIARALDTTATLSSQVIGTPAYMAPEQIRGQAVGPAVDVFAWAATIVYAASGVPPFGNDSISMVVNRILFEQPEIGELPGPLGALLARCLDKDPDRRPAAHGVLLYLLGDEHGRAGAGEQAGAALPAAPVPELATVVDAGRAAASTELLERGATVAAEHTPAPGLVAAAMRSPRMTSPAVTNVGVTGANAGVAAVTRPVGGRAARGSRRAVTAAVTGLATVAAAAVVGVLTWSYGMDHGRHTGRDAGYQAPEPATGSTRPAGSGGRAGVSRRPAGRTASAAPAGRTSVPPTTSPTHTTPTPPGWSPTPTHGSWSPTPTTSPTWSPTPTHGGGGSTPTVGTGNGGGGGASTAGTGSAETP